MKPEPLVTRALRDAITYCEGRAVDSAGPSRSAPWARRAEEYWRLLMKLKPAKSVPKRGRR